jgi:hypothetical protein
VAAHGFQTYLDDKTDLKPSDDPVEDLRAGWDLHVGFGLANPAIYSLMYGAQRPGASAPAAAAAAAVLAGHIRRIAEAGRLRVSEERAAQFVHAVGCGMTRTAPECPGERLVGQVPARWIGETGHLE